METQGLLAPQTKAAARDRYETVGPAAQTVTKEVARAMEFAPEEYNRRVTSQVVETARDALFASLLQVHMGNEAEFQEWSEAHPSLEVHLEGSENVEGRAWHSVPPADVVAAVTFHDEPEAAVATVQRQAFGRFYRDFLPTRE